LYRVRYFIVYYWLFQMRFWLSMVLNNVLGAWGRGFFWLWNANGNWRIKLNVWRKKCRNWRGEYWSWILLHFDVNVLNMFFCFFDMYQKCVWLFLYGFWICFWELIQNLFTVKFTVKKNIITRMSKYTTRLGFVVLYWNLTRDFSRGSWVRFGPRDWINLFMFVLILYEKDKTAAHWFFSLCFRLFFRSLLLNVVLRNFLCQNNTTKLWNYERVKIL
jgi:hypothetical protein